MLQQGHDAQACDYDGRTGVMLAAAGGHHGVIRILLAARADVNAVDNTGRTALDEACSKHMMIWRSSSNIVGLGGPFFAPT